MRALMKSCAHVPSLQMQTFAVRDGTRELWFGYHFSEWLQDELPPGFVIRRHLPGTIDIHLDVAVGSFLPPCHSARCARCRTLALQP